MIPAVFSVGAGVSNEAENFAFTDKEGKLNVECKIRGIPFRGEEAEIGSEKYAFLIRKKSTGKIRVVERPPLLFKPVKSGEEEISQVTSNHNERGALIDNFGSGRLKRVARERQEREKLTGNIQQVNALVAVASGEGTKKKSPSLSEVLPPILDAQAASPSGVYNVSAIVPTGVCKALQEEAQSLAKSTAEDRLRWVHENTYDQLIISRLQYLPANEEKRLRSATHLAMLQAMFRLYRTPAAQLRSSTALSTWPAALSKHLLSKFTVMAETSNRRIRCCPTSMKVKLMHHMLVVLLDIDNYRINLQDLIDHFKMSSVRLQKFFQAIGCKIETDANGGKKTVVLKPPLNLP